MKQIRINKYEEGFYTLEEIILKYKNYINKVAIYCKKIYHPYDDSTLYDIDDLISVGNLGIIKTYNNYEINYRSSKTDSEEHDQSEPIGFFSLLDTTVKNDINLYVKKLHKLRNKKNDFNCTISSFDSVIYNEKSDPIYLKDVVVDENSTKFSSDLENTIIVEECLTILKDKERKILEMYYFENMKQREISQITGDTRNTICRTIIRCLKKMKNYQDRKEKLANNQSINKKAINNQSKAVISDNFNKKRGDNKMIVDNIEKAIEIIKLDIVDNNTGLYNAITNYCTKNSLVISDFMDILRSPENKELFKSLKDSFKTSSKMIQKKSKEDKSKEIKPKESKKTPIKQSNTTNAGMDIVVINQTVKINEILFKQDSDGVRALLEESEISNFDIIIDALQKAKEYFKHV